jgi:hypothetical protein
MKVYGKTREQERQETYDRAFGSGAKKDFSQGPKQSEFYVHKTIAKHLREHYPGIRFYSTLDGFDHGNQRILIGSLQWFEPGVPDLFIFKRNKKYTMLVLEIKKDGSRTEGTEHLDRQRGWLDFLQSQGARATFVVGVEEGLKEITNYMKL